ncbi:MAG: DUF4342 domain-containing protein [Armatimonadetes bacterium]|nr:DUF4342 domain-containing protein [Armatimonadota bacterium]
MAESKKGSGSAKEKTTASGEKKVKTEEFKATSDNLVDELKRICREGNVRRVIVRSKDGRELLNMPLTVGLIGIALVPFFVAVAAIVGLAKEFTIVVERRVD